MRLSRFFACAFAFMVINAPFCALASLKSVAVENRVEVESALASSEGISTASLALSPVAVALASALVGVCVGSLVVAMGNKKNKKKGDPRVVAAGAKSRRKHAREASSARETMSTGSRAMFARRRRLRLRGDVSIVEGARARVRTHANTVGQWRHRSAFVKRLASCASWRTTMTPTRATAKMTVRAATASESLCARVAHRPLHQRRRRRRKRLVGDLLMVTVFVFLVKRVLIVGFRLWCEWSVAAIDNRDWCVFSRRCADALFCIIGRPLCSGLSRSSQKLN